MKVESSSTCFIAVTTLSGLSFGLLVGLLRVDTPLVYAHWCITYFDKLNGEDLCYTYTTCILEIEFE